jgi:hypothetical protein
VIIPATAVDTIKTPTPAINQTARKRRLRVPERAHTSARCRACASAVWSVGTVTVFGLAFAVAILLVCCAPPGARRMGGAADLVRPGRRWWEEENGQESRGVPRCQAPPNKGVQATANSVRSCLAPALRRA